MPNVQFDTLAIGNAIVDAVAGVDDDLIVNLQLRKGAMTLVDEAHAEALFSRMQTPRQISGGSAANTVAGVASLGGRAAFIGKVKNDQAGETFAKDIRALGVHFESPPMCYGAATARCLVFVTPDGERTMATYLGASQGLNAQDIDPALIEQSAIVYLEGYLWDPPNAKDAFRLASEIAHTAGRRVAFSLSDPFCVDRYRDEFVSLLSDGTVDVLFANQHELKSLYQTGDLEKAIAELQRTKIIAAVTKSEEGCSVLHGPERLDVPAVPVQQVIDATGAGDLFASGFLFGLSRGTGLAICAQLGALAAAEAISHFGARPETDLRALALCCGLLS